MSQWLAKLAYIQEVAGSSPALGTINYQLLTKNN